MIVRQQHVTEVTNLSQTQRLEILHQYCRLQGLRGTLLYIVRLQQVTEVKNQHGIFQDTQTRNVHQICELKRL